MRINESEIRKAIAVMKPDNELFEIRVIGKNKRIYSGYFKGADGLIRELSKQDNNSSVYITLNNIQEACYGRTQNERLIEAKETTVDKDIAGYKWLMVDLDPERPTGVASSNEELEEAKQLGNKIYGFLTEFGFEKPLIAESGNGVHLLYQVHLGNNENNTKLLKKCLETLDMLFSTDAVKVDKKNFNASRICKLYGTYAVKGSDTPDRPHRISRILKEPGGITDIKYLEKLCTLLPQDEKPQQYNNYHPQEFDLEAWLSKYGIGYQKESTSDYEKYVLDECPFDSNHKGKDACIFRSRNGAIGFYCFHNSCAGKTWRDVRLKYEPDAYDQKNENWHKESYKPNKYVEIKEVADKPVFYTAMQIYDLPKVSESFVKTGTTVIDKRLRGLKKGFVSVISGLRGSAKSTILNQWTLNAVNDGYKVALFSGELSEKNVMRWMYLQAAGKSHTERGEYEGYYNVPQKYQKLIAEWLGSNFYLFNNVYGNNFHAVISGFEKLIVNQKLDLLILDNLMAFDITDLADTKWDAQTQFVLELQRLAKKYNVHIIFVAHPKKAMGFLRLDDISGTADLGNAVDNAFIIHRVNNDFRRLTAQMFGWKADNGIYTCTNCIEIAKDRDGGTQDVFVPLYYEVESKRLKNDMAENVIYGWENKILDNEMPFD